MNPDRIYGLDAPRPPELDTAPRIWCPSPWTDARTPCWIVGVDVYCLAGFVNRDAPLEADIETVARLHNIGYWNARMTT